MSHEQIWNWLYSLGDDFYRGTRCITVMPDHLRNASMEHLERVAAAHEIAEKQYEVGDDSWGVIIFGDAYYYCLAARAEFKRRKAKAALKVRPPKVVVKPTRTKAGYVYLVQSPTGYFKIGHTVDPENRMRTFKLQLPFEVEYICCISTSDRIALERKLHQRFEDKRVKGEWFELASEDVEYIKGLQS